MREKSEIERKIGIVSEKVAIKEENGRIEITLLDEKYVITKNMQETGNAFEAWAIIARICSDSKLDVVLDVNNIENIKCNDYKGNGHWCRFLYRVLKFREQYEWFKLSKNLDGEVTKFRKYLYDDNKRELTTTAPTKEAENTESTDDENAVEAELAKPGELRKVLGKIHDIGKEEVYRQLPVGLFKGKKCNENAIFTHRRSAIDLWSLNGDEINVVELKTGNTMLGIITEIFFYANFINDLIQGNFALINPGNENIRGYATLYNEIAGIKKINGIMVADKFHSKIEKNISEIICTLNKNNSKEIEYYVAKYRYELTVESVDAFNK